MSERMDSLLDPERLADCAHNEAAMQTAHGITRVGPAKVGGKHLSEAANEPASLDVLPELVALNALECARLREVSDADFLAADVERNVNKGERLAAEADRRALEAQVLNLDAMRRAGW